MKNFKTRIKIILTLLLLVSCSTDPTILQPEVPVIINPIITEPTVYTSDLGTTSFYITESDANQNLILVNDAQNNSIYLMDNKAKISHEWLLEGKRLGNDGYLRPDGTLLVMLESQNPQIEIGGFGGRIEILDKNSDVLWSFEYSDVDKILHHDALTLPNGNILTMIWERKSKEQSITAGYSINVETFPDGLIEINPSTNEIVWEWRVWDHLIQDYDDSKENFGSIEENPQLIDINYNQNENGDITHANGIAYDEEKDVIYLSANFYSEVWVIDHSTTSAEASLHTGGRYEQGGDLIYRFGNPTAYQNPNGVRLFNNNHFPNLLDGADKGKMLIYSNGADLGVSTVYELQLPNELVLNTNANNEPMVVWSFTDPELYAPKVSGADKLPNGNILITEGDFGIWEVTPKKEVVWKFSGDGFFWRSYHFNKDAPEIKSLGL